MVEGFLRHRARLARLVAVVGVLVIAAQVVPVIPREVALRYDLGPAHASVRGLELVYQAGDQDLASARFGFGEEGPRLVDHRVDLAPGHYDVRATLDTAHGPVRFVRPFEAPADGVVRIELFDLALARAKDPAGGVSEVTCHTCPLNPTRSQTSLPWHPHVAVLVWHSVPFGAEGAVLPP